MRRCRRDAGHSDCLFSHPCIHALPANDIGIYEAPWIKSFFLLASIFTAVIFAVGMLFREHLM